MALLWWPPALRGPDACSMTSLHPFGISTFYWSHCAHHVHSPALSAGSASGPAAKHCFVSAFLYYCSIKSASIWTHKIFPLSPSPGKKRQESKWLSSLFSHHPGLNGNKSPGDGSPEVIHVFALDQSTETSFHCYRNLAHNYGPFALGQALSPWVNNLFLQPRGKCNQQRVNQRAGSQPSATGQARKENSDKLVCS